MKKIIPGTLVLFAFLMAIPVMPAAATNARVFVSPTDARADLGSDFTVNIMLTDVSAFCAYDVTLRYNTQVLTAVSASLGHTVFDLENDGDLVSDTNRDGVNDVFVSRFDILRIIGRVRAALTLVALPGIDVGTAVSLLSITFHVDNEGSSPLNLTGPLDFPDPLMVQCKGSGGPTTLGVTTIDGTYNLPAILSLIECRPDPRLINRQTGPVETIKCTVMNTGARDETARLDFLYRYTRAGQVGSGSTEALIPAGMSSTLEFPITAQCGNDKVLVAASLFRVHMTMSGDPLDIHAGSGHTFFNIENLC